MRGRDREQSGHSDLPVSAVLQRPAPGSQKKLALICPGDSASLFWDVLFLNASAPTLPGASGPSACFCCLRTAEGPLQSHKLEQVFKSPVLRSCNRFAGSFYFRSASQRTGPTADAGGDHWKGALARQQTWQAMVPAPLQVEGRQIQGARVRQHEEPLGQLLVHQLVLHLQLGWSREKAPHDGVQATCKTPRERERDFSEEFWRNRIAARTINYAGS